MSDDLFKKVSKQSISAYQERLANVLKLSPATVNRRISALRKFCAWAEKEGYLKENPFMIPKKEIKRIKVKLPRYLDKLRPSIPSIPYLGNAYKIYQSIPITNYLHYAVLIIFCAALGFGFYQQFFARAPEPLAFPAEEIRPKRYLSFQGRLTDSSDNPISSQTNFVFKLYDAASGGNTLWDSATCQVTPDQDGIFAVILGTTSGSGYTCSSASEIASSVFSENAEVWLGVKVASDNEATPRIQVATVAYALNAETLQGFPLASATSGTPEATMGATARTVPALNPAGNLVIAATSPTLWSTSGTFAIKGQALSIVTDTGTDGNIAIDPDGTGKLNITLGGATGNQMRITDANITGDALVSVYAGTNATGFDLLGLSSGSTETTVFSVDESGNTYAAGSVGIGTTNPGVSLDVVGGSIRTNADMYTGDLYLGYDDTSATITTSDNENLTIDPNSTGDIYFHGSTYYIDDSSLAYLSGLATTNYTPTSGEIRADVFRDGNSNYYIQPADTTTAGVFAGKVGIGTTAPSQKLDVAGNATVSGTLALGPNAPAYAGTCDASAKGKLYYNGTNDQMYYCNGSSWVVMGSASSVFGSGTQNYIPKWQDSSTLTNSIIYETGGNIGIGTTNPGSYKLNIAGTTMHQNAVYFANGTTYYVDASGNAKFLDLIAADTGNPGLTVGNGTTGYALIGGSTISDAAGNLTLDSDTAYVAIADDLLITGNDIYDSTPTQRINLGATTTLYNTTTTLSGTTALTASSLATLTTAAGVSWGGATSLTFTADNATIYGSDVASGNLALEGTSNSTKTTSYLILQPTGGNVGIGTTSPSSALSVGASSQFQVNTSGDIIKLKNLTYSWPSSQVSGGFLRDTNGSGTLEWTTTVPATSISFTNITSGTNTQAAMVVGAGASLNYTSTGTINASSLIGGTWAIPGTIGSGTPNTGAFTTLSASTSVSSPLFQGISAATTFGNASYNTTINGANIILGAVGNATNEAVRADRALTFTQDTNVTISNSGVAQNLTADRSWTLGWTGQLSIARGGTNSTATPTAGGVAYGTGSAYAFSAQGSSGQFLISGGTGAPTWTSTVPATSIPFSGITSGTNTQAAMVVGTGASLGYSGSGTIDASHLGGYTAASYPRKAEAATITGGWTFNTANTTFSGINVYFPGSGIWNSSGNVGIGTAGPSGKLQVTGDEVRIGDAGTLNYASGDGDLYVEDMLEVDGTAYFASEVNLIGNGNRLVNAIIPGGETSSGPNAIGLAEDKLIRSDEKYTISTSPSCDSGSDASMFDGASNSSCNWTSWTDGVSTATVEITLSTGSPYHYWHAFRIEFPYSRSTSGVKVEKYYDTASPWNCSEAAWSTIYETSSFSGNYLDLTSSLGNGICRFKVTLSGNAATANDVRISEIMGYQYYYGLQGAFVRVTGDIMYGDLTIGTSTTNRNLTTYGYNYVGGTTYYAGNVSGDAKLRYLGLGGANPTSTYPLDVTGAGRFSGDLTVTGNDIISSTATAISLSGANVTVQGNLTVSGTFVSVGTTTKTTNLNADLLDGMDSATTATALTIVARDSNADITQRYGFASYFNMSHSAADRNSDTVFYSSTDNYIRKNTASGMRTSLELVAGGTGDIWVEKAGDSMTGTLYLKEAVGNQLGFGDSTEYLRMGLDAADWRGYIALNAYHTGANSWNYVSTSGYGGTAAMMDMLSGAIRFHTANNAADPVSWNQRMSIANNGDITMSNNLTVTGTASFNSAGVTIDASSFVNAQRFVDIGTGYYVDPASTSIVSHLDVRGNLYDNVGNLTINDTVDISGNLTVSGYGQFSNIYISATTGRPQLSSNASGLLIDATNDAEWDMLVYETLTYVGNLRLGYNDTAILSTYDAAENLTIDPNGAGYTDIVGTVYLDTTNVTGTLAVTGDITLTGAISDSDTAYVTIADGLYVNTGTLYSEGTIEARGLIYMRDAADYIYNGGGDVWLNDNTTVSGNLTVSGTATANDFECTDCIDVGDIGANAVHQSEIYLLTQQNSCTTTCTATITTAYSFFPYAYKSSAAATCSFPMERGMNITQRAMVGINVTVMIEGQYCAVDWHYVGASPPHYLNGYLIKGFIYFLWNKETGQLLQGHTSPDPPWDSNGDMNEFPHPFFDYLGKELPEPFEIAIIDPEDLEIWEKEVQAMGARSVLGLFHNWYEVDPQEYTPPISPETGKPITIPPGTVWRKMRKLPTPRSAQEGGSVGGVKEVPLWGGDIAEGFETLGQFLEPGDIIVPHPTYVGAIDKSTTPYQKEMIGIISTRPSLNLDGYTDPITSLTKKKAPVALSGVVPTKVSTINGQIMIGDPITSSNIPGVGMKATQAGPIIGKALEPFDETQGEPCPDNPNYKCGKIQVFVNLGWYDPSAFITDAGELGGIIPINTNTTNKYQLVDKVGEAIDRFIYAGEAVIANLKTGLIESKKIKTEKLISPLVETEQLTAEKIQATESKFGKIISTQIETDKLQVKKDATIAGTLYADKVVAREIIGVQSKFGELIAATISAERIQGLEERLAQLEAQASPTPSPSPSPSSTPSPEPEPTATESGELLADVDIEAMVDEILNTSLETFPQADLSNIDGEDLKIANSLTVLGPTSLADTSVAGNLSVDGTLTISGNSIDTLTDTLYLQSLGLGGVDILAGKIVIDEKGNMTVEGDIRVKGSLFANIISPLPEQDLTIDLKQKAVDETQDSGFGKLIVKGVEGEVVASIEASGTATFKKLAIAKAEEEVIQVSTTEVETNATAGKAVLPSGEIEITIKSQFVTDKTMVYVTPTSDTQNKVLFVKAKKGASEGEIGWFKVGVDVAIDTDIQFNWWIIN